MDALDSCAEEDCSGAEGEMGKCEDGDEVGLIFCWDNRRWKVLAEPLDGDLNPT
jgi:hypothetical protein